MLDRKLPFEETLDRVRQGADYVEARFDQYELAEYADAISTIHSLLRMSSLSGEGLFERWIMLRDFMGSSRVRKIQKGEAAGTWDKNEWQPTERLRTSVLGRFFEQTLLPKQRVFWHLFDLAGAPSSEYAPGALWTCSELALNCVERGAESLACFSPTPNQGVQWSTTLHESQAGLLLSTKNLGEFHPYSYLKKRQQQQQQTPDGVPIDPPRYFYNFGNGEGFIRGNGMKHALHSPHVHVRFQVSKTWVMAKGWRHNRSVPFVHAYAFSERVSGRAS